MNQNNPIEILKVQGQLFTKILNVLTKVEKIEQTGYNSHQKYHYSTEKDLLNAVRQLLIDNKLLILTDSETKEVIKLNKYDKGLVSGENLVTVVNTRHTFCDSETGYTYAIQSTGTGFDNTDKGAFKAITGAMKYFVAKNFMVATEDDPESDGEAVKTPVTKGFSRSAVGSGGTTTQLKDTNIVSITSSGIAAGTVTKTEVVELPKVPNDTSQVIEKFTQPTIAQPVQTSPLTTSARASFSRRTTVKSEPNFP